MEVCFNTVVVLPEVFSIPISQTNVCTALIVNKGSVASGQTCGRITKNGNRCGYHKHK